MSQARATEILGTFWIPLYSRQRLPCSGSLMTQNNVSGFYIHYKILIETEYVSGLTDLMLFPLISLGTVWQNAYH